jgi:hypothetical protein
MVRSDQMRARALHDAARLREALALIAQLAEGTTSALTLPDIARIARAALVSAEPEDPRLSLGPAKH